jgi:hypothetical protein
MPMDERIAYGLGAFVGLRRREICVLTPAQVFAPSGMLVNFQRKGGGHDVTPYADMCEVFARAMPHLHADALPQLLVALSSAGV